MPRFILEERTIPLRRLHPRAPGSPLRRLSAWLSSFLALSLLAAGFLSATTLRPLNLEELTQKAGTIVVGRCVAVGQGTHTRLHIPLSKVTIQVDRTLKGRAGKTLTFQTAFTVGSNAVSSSSKGLARFRAGEKVILFLYPESSSGFTSPVGSGQGKFLLLAGKDGREIAVNGFGNRFLLKGLSGKAAEKLGAGKAKGRRNDSDPVGSADLIRMVEALGP
ncbi:MAG: hypothetical protein L0170_02075 [Acidobacteria bacterium]|nr:hypothetical protein [Acidobacteriota bacterium]